MTSADEAVGSSAPASIPNWRVIAQPSEDPSYHKQTQGILVRRGTWSDDCYRQALDLYDQLMACQDSYVSGPISSALNCLDHAYRLYGPESVICSFNGGKDAVVILHLVRAAHAHYYRSQKQQDPVRPRVIYFEHSNEFPDILSFLRESVDRYDLEMLAFETGTKFAEGLEVLVKQNFPSSMLLQQVDQAVSFPLAFVLGTRTTDPNAGNQGQFAPSSHYMPPFMRVNPVLEWTYGHVWHFLRLFQLPYCCLYDQGYTSLGTVKNTVPCPALAVAGGTEYSNSSIPKYWPAYMLRDWDQERGGRISKGDSKKKEPSKKQQQPKKKVSLVDVSESSNHSSLGHLSAFSERPFTTRGTSIVDDEASCVSFSDDGDIQRTVGILIIGDEILKGLTADTNTQAAAKALRNNNVLLKRVVVVSDDLEDIVQEIGRLQKEVDVVITSGGVGESIFALTVLFYAVSQPRRCHNGAAAVLGYRKKLTPLLSLIPRTHAPRTQHTQAQHMTTSRSRVSQLRLGVEWSCMKKWRNYYGIK